MNFNDKLFKTINVKLTFRYSSKSYDRKLEFLLRSKTYHCKRIKNCIIWMMWITRARICFENFCEPDYFARRIRCAQLQRLSISRNRLSWGVLKAEIGKRSKVDVFILGTMNCRTLSGASSLSRTRSSFVHDDVAFASDSRIVSSSSQTYPITNETWHLIND